MATYKERYLAGEIEEVLYGNCEIEFRHIKRCEQG